MPLLDTTALRHVDALQNYLGAGTHHPGVDMLAPSDASPAPLMTKYTVPIHDLRDSPQRPSLDDNGFTFLRAPTATRDFFNHIAVSEAYFAECALLVRAATGACHVHAFDYNLRDKALAPDQALLLKCFDSDPDIPARYTAHCAFHDPSAVPGSPPRRSIEVRTVAFFD